MAEALTLDLHKKGRQATYSLAGSGTSPVVPALNLPELFSSQCLPEPDPLTFLTSNGNSFSAQIDSVSDTDFQSSHVALIGTYMVGRCHLPSFPLLPCAYQGSRRCLLRSAPRPGPAPLPSAHLRAALPCCQLILCERIFPSSQASCGLIFQL